MRSAFGDAGYWVALIDEGDALHEKAILLSNRLRDIQIISTEMVLTELLNHASGYGPLLRSEVAQFGRDLRQNPNVEIIPQSSALFEAALIRYERFRDKQWGLTDALAYAHHFPQAGFRALLREP